MTLAQKRNHFYYVLKKFGITLHENDISVHGLRHEYMQRRFHKKMGIQAPVKGGDLSLVDKDELHVASQQLMEEAGHNRVGIGAAYYGSRRVSRTSRGKTDED